MSLYRYRHERLNRTGFRRGPAGQVIIEEPREWYTPKQVKGILGVSRQTVHRAIHSGALAAESFGGVRRAGTWRISHKALLDYIASGQRRPST